MAAMKKYKPVSQLTPGAVTAQKGRHLDDEKGGTLHHRPPALRVYTDDKAY